MIARTACRGAISLFGIVALSFLSAPASAGANLGLGEMHLSSFRPGPPPAGFDGICQRYQWVCGSQAPVPLDADTALPIAQAINTSVNKEIAPKADSDQFGTKELWTLPDTGQGDCEDYSLLKMKRLIEAGIPRSNLLLSVVVGSAPGTHVVLVLRTNEGDYILDNLSSKILTWKQTRYTFIKMQSASDRKHWDIVLLGPRAIRPRSSS